MTMTKQIIGKFRSFRFKGRKENVSGVVLDYNDNWTLLKKCDAYNLDGFIIFKNERAEDVYGDYEKRASKILKLKGYNYKEEPQIPIDNLANIFKFISDKYKLIQLDVAKGDAFDVVSYRGEENSLYLFAELTTNAKWRYKLELPEKECRYISFDNDYLNSLLLITKFD